MIAVLVAGPAHAQRAPVGDIYGPVPVTNVVDGDTIVVASNVGPRRVRLIGIDAPEPRDSDRWFVGLGLRAAQALADMLPPDDLVWLELDLGIEDTYGRLLAYVYIADPEGEWRLGDVRATQLNLAMVQAGMAAVLTIQPNSRYSRLYLDAQIEAMDESVGLWTEEPPEESRLDLSPLPDGPIVIECALYNPATPNDENGEWVTVWIREPMYTTGYRIFDGGSGTSFYLPAGLQPAGEQRVDNPGQGVWNNSGDTIFLMLGDRVVDMWNYSDRLVPEGSITCRGAP